MGHAGCRLQGEIRRGLMRRGVAEIVQAADEVPDDGVDVAAGPAATRGARADDRNRRVGPGNFTPSLSQIRT